MTQTVLVPLADGFEEIEAMTIIDVLRRAELDVTTASLRNGQATGAHGVVISADTTLAALVDAGATFDAVVLPGGMPGASNLRDDERLHGFLKATVATGGTAAAICAAPMALDAAGLLVGKRATCYPGFEEHITSAAERCEDRVVTDGQVVTSRGPGTAMEFALALVHRFKGEETAAALHQGLLAK